LRRNLSQKALYANRKHQLAKAEQLFSIAEELARSEERVKQIEAQLKDLKERERGAASHHSTISCTTNAIPLSYRIA
jgi:predicted phage-related endonuclease